MDHVRPVPDGAPEGVPSGGDPGRLSDLLRQAALGDEAAFAAFYDATSARVYGVVLRVLQSPDHAAEVTQDVYLDVWRLAAQFDPARGRAISWLMTMAHRRAVEAVRSIAASRARDDRIGLRDQIGAVDEVWEAVTSATSSS